MFPSHMYPDSDKTGVLVLELETLQFLPFEYADR